jgi:hypothetical protein
MVFQKTESTLDPFGDESDGVKGRDPFERQLTNARGERRDQGRARSSPTTMRRASANAPQRAGAAQRKVAMSRPGPES